MIAGALGPSWSQKILSPFRAAPRKSGVLGGLGLLLVIMWVRVLTGAHPRSAAAHLAPTQPTMITGPSNLNYVPVPRSASSGNSIKQWASAPIVPLQRNFFAVPIIDYPREPSGSGDDSQPGGFWDRLAKSVSNQADHQEQRQILIDNLRQRAAALSLQSTIMGDQPSAVVNGETVHEGDIVEGFRILKIEPGRMTLEYQDVKLERFME